MRSTGEVRYGTCVSGVVVNTGVDVIVRHEGGDVLVPAEEWSLRHLASRQERPQQGTVVEVQIIRPGTEGAPALGSRRRVQLRRRWHAVEVARATRSALLGRVVATVGKAPVVDVGLSAWAKSADVAAARAGSYVTVYVRTMEPALNMVRVSRSPVALREDYERLSPGDVMVVEILDLASRGARVTDGVVEGWVLKPELAHSGVAGEVRRGDRIEVVVVEVDPDEGWLLLSEKARLIQRFAEAHAVGDAVRGRVVKIVSFGAFVDVGGLEGLVHVSEIPGAVSGRVKEVLSVGDQVEVAVVAIDVERKRLALSIARLAAPDHRGAETPGKAGTGHAPLPESGNAAEPTPRVQATPILNDAKALADAETIARVGDVECFERQLDALLTGRRINGLLIHELMRTLARDRYAQAVQVTLEVALRHGVPRPEFAFEAAMRGWAYVGEPDRADALLAQAEELGLLNAHHYLAVAEGWVRAKRHDRAAELLCRMLSRGSEPPPVSYLRVVEAIAADGEEEAVRPTMTALSTAGLEPPVAASASAGFRFGIECSGSAAERDAHVAPAPPASGCSAALAAITTGRLDDARDCLRAAMAAGDVGFRVRQLYVELLGCLSRAGRSADAEDELAAMAAAGLYPDGYHYWAVMKGYAVAGEVRSVQRLFGDLLERGLAVTSHQLSVLITALSVAGFPEAAETELAQLEAMGVVPDPRHHFGPILTAYRRLGRARDAAL